MFWDWTTSTFTPTYVSSMNGIISCDQREKNNHRTQLQWVLLCPPAQRGQYWARICTGTSHIRASFMVCLQCFTREKTSSNYSTLSFLEFLLIPRHLNIPRWQTKDTHLYAITRERGQCCCSQTFIIHRCGRKKNNLKMVCKTYLCCLKSKTVHWWRSSVFFVLCFFSFLLVRSNQLQPESPSLRNTNSKMIFFFFFFSSRRPEPNTWTLKSFHCQIKRKTRRRGVLFSSSGSFLVFSLLHFWHLETGVLSSPGLDPLTSQITAADSYLFSE